MLPCRDGASMNRVAYLRQGRRQYRHSGPMRGQADFLELQFRMGKYSGDHLVRLRHGIFVLHLKNARPGPYRLPMTHKICVQALVVGDRLEIVTPAVPAQKARLVAAPQSSVASGPRPGAAPPDSAEP